MTVPIPFGEVVAAVAQAAARLPEDDELVLGPAQVQPSGRDLFLGTFEVRTGPVRLADVVPGSIELRPAAGGGAGHAVEAVTCWEADRLTLRDPLAARPLDDHDDPDPDADTDDLEPIGRDGRPDASSGWIAVARRNRRTRMTRLADRLAASPHPGLGAALLGADLAARRPDGPPHPFQVICGPDAPRRRAVVLAAGELLAAGLTAIVLADDPETADQLASGLLDELGDAPPATVVRVGVPSSATVASSERLRAEQAAASRSPHLLAELADVAAEGRALGWSAAADDDHQTDVSPRPSPSGDARVRAGAPPAAPTATATATGGRANALAELAERDALLVAALRDVHAAATAHVAARDRARQFDAARRAFRRIDLLVRSVEETSSAAAAAAAGLARAAQEPGNGTPTLLAVADAATTRLDRRDRAIAALEAARAAATATGHTRAAVQRADREVVEARSVHAAAERAALRARAARARAAAAVDAPATGATPALGDAVISSTPAVETMAGTAGARSLAAAVAVADRVTAAAAACRALRDRHASLRRDIAAVAEQLVDDARIVVTTFDELLADEALAHRRFDHVLVEGANTFPAAALVWAASLADRSIVLADPLDERPPRAPAGHPTLDTPVLTLLGLDTAAAVAAHPAGLLLD